MPAHPIGCQLAHAISSLGSGDGPEPTSLLKLKPRGGFLSSGPWVGFPESGFVTNTPDDSDMDCMGELWIVSKEALKHILPLY